MTRKRLTVHDIGKPFYVSDRATVTKNPDDVRFYAGRAGSNDLFYAGSTEGIFEADLIGRPSTVCRVANEYPKLPFPCSPG